MTSPDRRGLDRYRDLHLWMLIPMVVMQAGIFVDYWGDFTDNAWAVHVHYWTASLWYVFLVSQPWFATRRRFETHRTYGIIGMFLAGGTAMTAIGALHRDIVSAERVAASPGIFGPFPSWFFYGVAAIELVMMTAFIVTIIQSIRYRKQVHDHAWWLITSVFVIMMPSVGRGLGLLWPAITGTVDLGMVRYPVFVSTALTLALLFWAARRYGTLNHPATWLAVFVNLFNCLVEPIGRWPWMQSALRTLIQG